MVELYANNKTAFQPGAYKQNNRGRMDGQMAIYIEELQKANREIQASRRALLNALEDAISSREALYKSQQQLSLSLEAAKMGTFEYTSEGSKMQLSEGSAGVFGLAKAELVATKEEQYKLLHPSDLEKYQKTFKKAVQLKSGYYTEFRIIRPGDEKIAWIAERGKAQADKETGAVIIHGVHWDITDKKNAERVLRQNEEQLQTLFNHAPMGMFLVDSYLRVKAVNVVARIVFGDASAQIGQDFDKLMHELWGQEYADEITGIIRHTLETGVSYSNPERIEYRRNLDTIEYYEWQVNRITLPGNGYGVVCYFRDVSPFVFARKAIARSEEKYRSLFEKMEEGLLVGELIYDQNGDATDWRYIELNPALESMIGLQSEQVSGKTRLQAFGEVDAYWLTIYSNVVADSVTQRLEYFLPASQRWFDVTVYASGLNRFVALYDDITERKRSEESLLNSELQLKNLNSVLEQQLFENRELLRKKDEFIRIASHELKTPLAPIIIGIELLLEKYKDRNDSFLYNSLTTLNRQTIKLTYLFNNLLDISRTDVHKLTYGMQEFDIAEMICETIGQMQPAIPHKLVFKGPQHCVLHGDKVRLNQVFLNLLTNAVKYSPKAEEVHIQVSGSNAAVTVAVQDFGIGIPQEHLDKIFDRFYRVEEQVANLVGGLGIGLYISAEIIKQHNGTITVESTKGKGSVFCLTLPLITT